MEEIYLWGYQAGEAVCDGVGWEEWVGRLEDMELITLGCHGGGD